jgi:uncharacterized GH25 family protein
MKPLLSLSILIAAALPLRAHFIWLIPDDDRSTGAFQMVFSDELGPDDQVPITKIAKTELFARAGGKGERVKVQATEAKHSYQVTHEGTGLVMVAGTCRYGVVAKGKGKPFLLEYHPKAYTRKGFVKDRAGWLMEANPELPLEIMPVDAKKPQAKVLWRGKPAADVEVVLHVPGIKESIKRTTNNEGLIEIVEPKAGGAYGLRARFVENKSGELDGKKYEEIRHYATFTFYIPARSVK